METSAQNLYQTAADIAWSGKNYSKVELDGRVWQYSVSSAVTSIVQDDEQQIKGADEIYQIRFVDITESRQTLRTLTATLFVIGMSLLLFFFFFSLFFSKRAVAPLREVLKKQQQFVADASHELKTPVSIIKANCSVLYANEEQTVASQKEWLDNIGTGADRMTALIENLLTLSKIEGTDNDLIPAEMHLRKVIEESFDSLDLRIKEKSLAIETSCGGDVIWSDPDRVRQLGGFITAESILDQNATFTLYFPKK